MIDPSALKALLDSGERAQIRQGVALAFALLPPADAAARLVKLAEEPGNIAYDLLLAVAPAAAAERAARLWSCGCVEHVLPIFEAKYPGDPRPREGVEAARRYARGELDAQELARRCAAIWGDLSARLLRDFRAAPSSVVTACEHLAEPDPWESTSRAASEASCAAWFGALRSDQDWLHETDAGPAAAEAERAWQRAALLEHLASLLAP